MRKVVDGLFLGDFDDATDLESLEENGIRGIVDCTLDSESSVDGMKYLRLKLRPRDRLSSRIVKRVEDFIDNVEGNVLVHCMAGAQRSPSIVVAYLTLKGMTVDDAVELIDGIVRKDYYPTRQMLRSILDLDWNAGKPMDLDVESFMETKEKRWARKRVDNHVDDLF